MEVVNYDNLETDELHRLAEIGISDAQVEYGARFLSGKSDQTVDYKSALKWFTLAADQNNKDALFNLATMYKSGTGVIKNNENAFRLYFRSMSQGFVVAEYFLENLCSEASNKSEVIKEVVNVAG